MKETTYKLRTISEILQMIPDSYISTDQIDSNMVYLHVGVGHFGDSHTYGLSRFCISTYLGCNVCLRIRPDCFEIKRFDGCSHTWKWNLRCLDDFIKIFCKTRKDFSFKRTCQSGLAATFED